VKRTPLVLLLLLASCGGDDPAAPSSTALATTTSAAIAVEIETSPVEPSGIKATPLHARWSVVIRETGGVGGSLGYVNTTLRDATSGARAWPSGTKSLGSDALTQLIGGTRLAAGATLRVPGDLTYAFVSGSKVGRLSAAVLLTDDNGHAVTALAEATVQ
jgi:hypothetical protein